MDESGVELEDVDVVEVTGVEHVDDGSRHVMKKSHGCSPSLRDATLLIFLGLLVIYGLWSFHLYISPFFCVCVCVRACVKVTMV